MIESKLFFMELRLTIVSIFGILYDVIFIYKQ